jgi:hypothetical protein
MSCILVGFATLKIDPDELSPVELAFCIVRDVAFTAWYTVLLYFSFTLPESECIQSTGIATWLFFAGIVTVLRLIKNPMQFIANRKLQRNGANWENPTDISQSWYRFFSPTFHICSMRIYSFVDWLSYFAWIVGLTSFRPIQQCNDNIVTVSGFYEIGISTLVYILSLLTYTVAYAIHRSSRGRCLPGFTILRSADGCPGVTFDRTQWRRSGESLQEYRERVVRHFEFVNYISTQPIALHQMSTNQEDCRLTSEELQSLRTLRYSNRLQRSPSVHTINGRKPSMRRPGRSKSDETLQVPEPHAEESNTVAEEGASEQLEVSSKPKESPSELVPEAEGHPDPSREEDRTTDDTCALCIEDYTEGDLLRELHCGHRYHAECVDEWLTTSKRTCPVCNSDAVGRTEPNADSMHELSQ